MQDPSNSRRPGGRDALSTILADADIRHDSVVRVTGPAGLAALLWFARHGFDHVGYVRPARRQTDDGDLLMIPQTCGASALDEILTHGPHVRPGGVLIVQTPEPPSDSQVDPVHDLLMRHGYAIERCLHGRHRELHVARRRAKPVAVAA